MKDNFGRYIAHVVEYKAYSGNSRAVEMMESKARETLARCAGPTSITFGKPYHTGRAVSNNDFDFGIVALFSSSDAMKVYMTDPNHLKWVEFVLNGYQMPNSKLRTSEERKAEFIEHVLNGKERFDWIRDSTVPDSEVVWSGEKVKDFGGI